MEFKIVDGYEYKEYILSLFDEYSEMLVENAPDFKKYLGIQGYEKEKADLSVKYGRPSGRLYIVLTFDGEPAGCVALTKLSDEMGELKRLYIRPKFRRNGLGKKLVQLILMDACEIGYSTVVLDTFPFLGSSQILYRNMDFEPIEKYNENPMEEAIFLKKDMNQCRN